MLIEQLLERLEGVKGSAPQWAARCPAHDDRQASLTVSVGRDERTLLTCWAGCELADIVHALGLGVRDLFPSGDDAALFNGKPRAPWGNRSLGEAVLPLDDELERFATRLLTNEDMSALAWERKGWNRSTLAAIGVGVVGDRFSIPVRNLDGKLVNHLRYRPDQQPKMLALKGKQRVPLYCLLEDQPDVWLVEGETDAISLTMVGLSTIGIPGASARARPEWLEPARGKRLLICFDVDEAGRHAAARWAHVALEVAAEVRVVELEGPEKFDVGDLVLAGRDDMAATRRGLVELADDAPIYVEAEPVRVEEPPPAQPSPEDVSADDTPIGAIVSTRMSTVVSERVLWLWRERIPVARVGVLFGPPGLGKSTFTAQLIADITRAGGNVLIASAEDDAATTLGPRLTAAGADRSRVQLIETRAQRGTTNLILPRDIDTLGERMTGQALLIIDPLTAHLGDDVNSWSDQSVRARVLAPLQWWARRTSCSVVNVMHTNKSDKGDALSRISGTGGFGGAARFALMLGVHPDDVGLDEDKQRVVVVHVKASEGRKQHGMIFRRDLVPVDVGDGDALLPILTLVDDQAAIDPELVVERTDPDERGAYTEALEWLRRELTPGPQLAKRLLAQARERGDFSERTLRKAKRALGVKSDRDTEGWWWRLDHKGGAG